MVPRMILCAVGVSLLLGCVRQDYELVPPAERVTRPERPVSERATPPNGTDITDVGEVAATRGAADSKTLQRPVNHRVLIRSANRPRTA